MTQSNDTDPAKPDEGTPGPGHNIADDAVVAVNLSKIKTAQEKNSSANGELRSTLKHAEGKGLDLTAAKKALQIARSGDAEAFIETTQKTLRYLKILGYGVPKAQIDLFDYASELAPIDEKAAEAGRNAGLLGEPESNNPHDLSTAAGQAWLGAHRQGYSERQIVLSMAADEEDDGGGGSELMAKTEEPARGDATGPGEFSETLEEPPPFDDDDAGGEDALTRH